MDINLNMKIKNLKKKSEKLNNIDFRFYKAQTRKVYKNNFKQDYNFGDSKLIF